MRLTAVSYLNTKPFIYGIYKSEIGDHVELSLDIPSVCAQKLLQGTADIALAPVAVIPELPQAHIISDYCIGSVGKVGTVCLYSEVPLEDIQEVLLDFHSKTSVNLVQVLYKHYWKRTVTFTPAKMGFEQQIKGTTAAVVIGDRTIGMDSLYPYVYDLGEAWTTWTGLPFVYAAWISVKPIQPDFIAQFNAALQAGLDHLPELIKILPTVPGFDLEAYYKNNISYTLDSDKRKGLQLFLSFLSGQYD
jgi:chorismate dehydratase